MVARMMILQEVHFLIPATCEYVTLHSKQDFAVVTMDFERGRSSRGCDVVTRVPSGKEGGGKVREVTAEAKVRLRRGASNQGERVFSRSWKRHGHGFSPRVSRRNAAPADPLETSDPQNRKRIRFCCFKPLKFWLFVTITVN